MNAGSSTSYRAAKGETTEWDDIQRRLGNKAPLSESSESEHESDEEKPDPLASKTVAQLDELEEDEYADSRELELYREKRLAEMRAKAARDKFGDVLPLSREEFVDEVTNASKENWVVVLLHQDHIPESVLMQRALAEVAARKRSTKFMQIKATSCIENYPDRHVPTLLLYHDGECQSRLTGGVQFDGKRMNANTVEWVLATSGAVETDLEDDPRKMLAGLSKSIFGRGGGAEQEDEEEDEDTWGNSHKTIRRF